jgi:hypothetical protein
LQLPTISGGHLFYPQPEEMPCRYDSSCSLAGMWNPLWRDVRGIHKRMVQFQKLIQNFLLTLRGHNRHCQQRELSTFLMRYQQFPPHAYCGAAGPVSKMASKQENAFCMHNFEVSRPMITLQREFRALFKKDALHKNNVECYMLCSSFFIPSIAVCI